eukprot:g3990.t1
MTDRFRFLFFFFLFFISAFAGDFTKIDGDNYKDIVLKSDEVWIVKFGSERCGSCAAFEPTFHEFVAKLDGSMKVGYVNIDEPKGIELARDMEVLGNGIPGVYLINSKEEDEHTLLMGQPTKTANELYSTLLNEDADKGKRDAKGYYLKTE